MWSDMVWWSSYFLSQRKVDGNKHDRFAWMLTWSKVQKVQRRGYTLASWFNIYSTQSMQTVMDRMKAKQTVLNCFEMFYAFGHHTNLTIEFGPMSPHSNLTRRWITATSWRVCEMGPCTSICNVMCQTSPQCWGRWQHLLGKSRGDSKCKYTVSISKTWNIRWTSNPIHLGSFVLRRNRPSTSIADLFKPGNTTFQRPQVKPSKLARSHLSENLLILSFILRLWEYGKRPILTHLQERMRHHVTWEERIYPMNCDAHICSLSSLFCCVLWTIWVTWTCSTVSTISAVLFCKDEVGFRLCLMRSTSNRRVQLAAGLGQRRGMTFHLWLFAQSYSLKAHLEQTVLVCSSERHGEIVFE